MRARVEIKLKDGVLDPEADAIASALTTQGFDGFSNLSKAKVIELELDDTDQTAAEAKVKAMCEGLLANTVIERYSISFV